MAAQVTHAIIGTAGHIDHGKSALVRALTGQETDRLKEEQERGISIDLGFAYFTLADGTRAGVIDVPGHERFIRNMLAGAHGMDLVLFTVAADDGVMPQSEEHLDILHLLGARRGIFIITKADLASDQRLAEGRIRPLSPAPPISTQVIESSHIVGMMGPEPIQAALAAGAGVVLAGRASDSALYAAIPLMLGADPGLSWHAAKTLECGAACAVVPAADCMFAIIREGHFDIEPLDLNARCTPQTIAAHTLYENAVAVVK